GARRGQARGRTPRLRASRGRAAKRRRTGAARRGRPLPARRAARRAAAPARRCRGVSEPCAASPPLAISYNSHPTTEETRVPDPTPAELIERAIELRPLLLADQAATEERSNYSTEMHEHFLRAGCYRMFVPKRYGRL